MIFVVNSLNLGQAGLLGVKLCECLKILEQTSRDSNQVTDIGLSLVEHDHHVTGILASDWLRLTYNDVMLLQVCKLCLVWTRPSSGDISTLSRLVRLYTADCTHVLYTVHITGLLSGEAD